VLARSPPTYRHQCAARVVVVVVAIVAVVGIVVGVFCARAWRANRLGVGFSVRVRLSAALVACAFGCLVFDLRSLAVCWAFVMLVVLLLVVCLGG
jgi:hypothetical protein